MTHSQPAWGRNGNMTSGAGGQAPVLGDSFLERAQQIFDGAAAEVAAALARLGPDRPETTGPALRAVRDLQAAFGLLMEERVRVDRLRREVAGVVGERSLDLDAARDEIGRRLARLRDAGGGD
jgi:hypothetical protein